MFSDLLLGFGGTVEYCTRCDVDELHVCIPARIGYEVWNMDYGLWRNLANNVAFCLRAPFIA